MPNINMRFPDDLHEKLRKLSYESREPITQIVLRATRKYLEEGKSVIYSAIIPIGAARREDRAPSTDGEYLRLFWCPAKLQYGAPQWMLESNAAVEASHYTSYTDAQPSRDELLEYHSEAEADRILAEAEEIQAEIDRLIQGTGEKADIDRMGSEARDLAQKWGWI